MRCLVVEDDEKWQEALAEVLRLRFECSFAKDAGEAIRMIEQAEKEGKPFQLITLDCQMGEGRLGSRGGERVLEFLQDYLPPRRRQTACIVVSGTASPDDVRDYLKGYKALECDFISKDSPQLLKRFKRMVDDVLRKGIAGIP